MPSDEAKLQKFLGENENVRYIRLQWIDYSGILRTRFVPVTRCLEIAQGNEEYLLPQVSMIFPVSQGPTNPGSDLETWVLRPDWSMLRCCGFRPSHASVMCFVEHKEAEDTYSKCPRTLLSRALLRLEKEYDTKVLAGFEIECMLLNKECEPLDELDRLNSYQTTNGLRGQKLDIVEEIINNLTASSINVYHFHTETRDQVEFALSPEPLIAAIDSLILAQETIRTVFVKYNIKATMTPKPLLAGPTNGIHLHLSVDKLAPPQTDNFLAGILTHMGPLCAFGMANFDGYVRTGADAAGTWVGYGTENRDLPVRKVSDQHWEFRMLDATANQYLFAASVLLAGLSGLAGKTDLTWEDCSVFPASVDESQRSKYTMDQKMPGSLQEALESLKKETALSALIPKDLLETYLFVKGTDLESVDPILQSLGSALSCSASFICFGDGRRPILLLAGTGEMLVTAWLVFICYFDWIFPPRLAWASALFIFIGGGQRVVVAMVFAIVSDQIDEAHRTRYMYIMSIGPHLSGLLTPPVEAFTMSISIWLPFAVSIGAYVLMLLVILAMPEAKTKLPSNQVFHSPVEPTGLRGEEIQSSKIPTSSFISMLKTRNLAICFSLFFLKRTAFMSEIFFYQYASANFDLELRQTPWFRSIREVSAVLVLSSVLPAITTSFQRQYNSQTIDLGILRVSLTTMVISFFIVYISLSSWLFTFGVFLCGAGEGIDPGIQALASRFVSSDHRAMMFTILAMIDATGKIIGGPLMGALYFVGMAKDGKSAGSCFLVTSILFGIAIFTSFGIR